MHIISPRREYFKRVKERLSLESPGFAKVNLSSCWIHYPLFESLKCNTFLELGWKLNILFLPLFQLWIISITDPGITLLDLFIAAKSHPGRSLSYPLIYVPLPSCITVLSKWLEVTTITVSITGYITKPSDSFKYSSKSIMSLNSSSCGPLLALIIAYLIRYISSRNAVTTNVSTLGLPKISISISVID